MRSIVRMSSWLVVLVLGHATVAWACSCAPLSPEELVASGDPIVVATITEVLTAEAAPAPASAGCFGGSTARTAEPATTGSATDDWPALTVTIDVSEIVAGTADLGPLEVKTNPDGASCGLDVAEGELWVLQLHHNDTGPYVSLCAASARIEGTDDPWLVTLRDAAAATP